MKAVKQMLNQRLKGGDFMQKTYPKAKEEALFVFQGQTLNDPYQWMRDGTNAQLLDWVKAQNAYSDDFFHQYEKTYPAFHRNKNIKNTCCFKYSFSGCQQGPCSWYAGCCFFNSSIDYCCWRYYFYHSFL